MERPIGEQFDFYDVKLEVVEVTRPCVGCYLLKSDFNCDYFTRNVIGFCCYFSRKDRKQVIFKEVQE